MSSAKAIVLGLLCFLGGGGSAMLFLNALPREKGVASQGISKGFFFYKGAYVTPPYHVIADQDGVKINGLVVLAMPLILRARPAPASDPGPFKWTKELMAKGIDKSGFSDNATDRFLVWKRDQGFDRACELYEEYLRKQPIVVKVERGGVEPFSLRYWTADGKNHGVAFTATSDETPDERRSRRTRDMEEHASNLRALLQEGGVFVITRGTLIVPSQRVQEWLPALYDALSPATSPEQRVKILLKRPDLFLATEEEASVFGGGFGISPSLRQRIDALRKERRVVSAGVTR